MRRWLAYAVSLSIIYGAASAIFLGHDRYVAISGGIVFGVLTATVARFRETKGDRRLAQRRKDRSSS
jgi:hypothetical protein